MVLAARTSRLCWRLATGGSRGAGRVLGNRASHLSRASILDSTLQQNLNASVISRTRRYYSGGGGGYGGAHNWDGLVHSIMSNLRGQTTHGPECFYHSDDSDNDSSLATQKRRDMREEVPLNLNRPYLLQTASDIALRLKYLAKQEEDTESYERMVRLQKLLTRLGNMDSDVPKLELEEYVEIWTTIRDGFDAANEIPLQTLTLNEQNHLKHVKWNAECVWGVAAVNAAVRRLPPIKTKLPSEDTEGEIGTSENEGEEAKRTLIEGNLQSMGFKIHGLLLDSKDFWPENKRWFSREEEEEIMGVVWRVFREGKKRDF